jgi:hypothetical protein
MNDDKIILVAALERAARDYKAINPRPTLLGPGPDASVLGPLSAAIETCDAYKAVAGHVLFSGDSGPVLHAPELAERLFSKGVQFGDDIPGAVVWLLRLLATRETTGLFKAAIWGLDVDQEVTLTKSSRLIPFATLPDSWMKGRISERAKPCYDGSVWMTHRYFDLPTTAFVKEVQNFPYIRTDNASFLVMDELVRKLQELSVLMQAACIGSPLAVACWFEYADRELEFSEWENSFTWLLPEIHPHVKRRIGADVGAIQSRLADFHALTEEQRGRLLRSMERFNLSQCRRESIDRVLDLALAFEIAVSEKGDNAPPAWKVSVRSAQMIGGILAYRQQNRATVSALYDLRNQATHGSTLKAKSSDKSVEQILQENYDLYVVLMKKLLSLRLKPEWKSIELGVGGSQ